MANWPGKVSVKQTPHVICHSGPQYVFQIGEARIWGSAGHDIKRLDRWALLVPLIDDYATYVPKDPIGLNTQARTLLPKCLISRQMPPVMTIQWPDMKIPYLSKEWWTDLVKFLSTFKGDVAFFCMGGHGRTGTCLTILATLAGRVPEGECPVAWIRAEYCEKAVESDEQLDYIEHITDEIIASGPSHTYHLNHWSQDDTPAYLKPNSTDEYKTVEVVKSTAYKANYPGKSKKRKSKKRGWRGLPRM